MALKHAGGHEQIDVAGTDLLICTGLDGQRSQQLAGVLTLSASERGQPQTDRSR